MALIIQAGGGVIKNERGQLLLIFRRKKWDLPKGKLDAGETMEECAIREVKEETGLIHVEIIRKITITHHTYYQDENEILKETHWFQMVAPTIGNETLTPQVEEEIEKIEWVDPISLPAYLENSYETIRKVISLL